MLLIALACGCGGDTNKSERPDAGHMDPGGGDGDAPGCGIQIPLYPGYTDPLVWSEANLNACDAACPGLQDTTCIRANCPDATAFFTCIDEELYACQTSPGHACYREYTEWNCCAFESCGDQQTDDQRSACLQRSCSAENNTVEECYAANPTSSSFVACRQSAYDTCLGANNTSCTPADADSVAGYAGTRPWTRAYTAAEYAACVSTCKGALNQAQCFDTKCPGAAEYRECIGEEATACTTQAGGECRGDWETVFCCARSKCSGVSSAQFSACLDSACASEVDAFNTCDANSREGTCKASAEAACALDHDDAGAPDSGASHPVFDGGMPDASTPHNNEDGGTPDGGVSNAFTKARASTGPQPRSLPRLQRVSPRHVPLGR